MREEVKTTTFLFKRAQLQNPEHLYKRNNTNSQKTRPKREFVFGVMWKGAMTRVIHREAKNMFCRLIKWRQTKLQKKKAEKYALGVTPGKPIHCNTDHLFEYKSRSTRLQVEVALCRSTKPAPNVDLHNITTYWNHYLNESLECLLILLALKFSLRLTFEKIKKTRTSALKTSPQS